MLNIVGIIIFFASIVFAWYIGYRSRLLSIGQFSSTQLPKDYFTGLNFLLNEETDKAVDVFIKMSEVDSNTVEMHLAIGKLFRKRGEVERAIRIHQNLIARPQLDKSHREHALFALGQDYLSAGMLDRAERIFTDLIHTRSHIGALSALLDIYQQEKAWDQAIQIAKKLEVATRKSKQTIIAHHWCQLAEVAFAKNQEKEASSFIDNALSADKQCVRASLLQAKFFMHREDYRAALRSLKRIKNQKPDYLSEAIEPIAQCYEKLNKPDELVFYLKQLLSEYPHTPVVLILAERIRQWKGAKLAANFVADYVRRYPSLEGINLFVTIYISMAEGRTKEDLFILHNLIKKLLSDKSVYQCISCGFDAKALHWFCPGCKQWNTIKPSHAAQIESAAL